MLLNSCDNQGNETKPANLNSDDIREMDMEISDIAANMFTGEFNFFAPCYHEVTMTPALKSTNEERTGYISAAQAEIKEAFDYYYEKLNNGRPFVIAGYSRGSIMAKEPVKHMTDEQLQHMAVAYIMGGSISTHDLQNSHITLAAGADDTRQKKCIASFK